MTQSIQIRRPDDFHVHLRRGDMLRLVAPMTAAHFARGLAMPNTDPPIISPQDVAKYRMEILNAIEPPGSISKAEFAAAMKALPELERKRIEQERQILFAPGYTSTPEEDAKFAEALGKLILPQFKPLMTAKLTQRTKPEDIGPLKEAGVIAMKAYPVGATTNSDDGVSDFGMLDSVFEAMADAGLILSIHGEYPEFPSLDREHEFVRWMYLPHTQDGKIGLVDIARHHPRLKIVLEHVTTAEAIGLIRSVAGELQNVAGTITAHHLLLTLDDVLGKPHNFCRPVAKHAKDREALVWAATSGCPRLFFGSDSAPHPRAKKEGPNAPAGCFTAPVALSILATVFDRVDRIEMLENFTSRFGAEFYGLPLNEGTIRLVREPWKVPNVCVHGRTRCAACDGNGNDAGRTCPDCGGSGSVGGVEVVPFMAGETLQWGVLP